MTWHNHRQWHALGFFLGEQVLFNGNLLGLLVAFSLPTPGDTAATRLALDGPLFLHDVWLREEVIEIAHGFPPEPRHHERLESEARPVHQVRPDPARVFQGIHDSVNPQPRGRVFRCVDVYSPVVSNKGG